MSIRGQPIYRGYADQEGLWKEKIDEFVDSVITDWTSNGTSQSKDTIHVHDPVWQSMTFSGDEVKVIDSPLLQRLKRVSQMGMAYTTYPGVGHSRFSHSLGVAHVAAKIFDEISPRIDEIKGEQLKKVRSTLRLAGLFHDCAQGPYSHISDTIYQNFFKFERYGQNRRNPTYTSNLHEYIAFDVTFNKFLINFIIRLIKIHWL